MPALIIFYCMVSEKNLKVVHVKKKTTKKSLFQGSYLLRRVTNHFVNFGMGPSSGGEHYYHVRIFLN